MKTEIHDNKEAIEDLRADIVAAASEHLNDVKVSVAPSSSFKKTLEIDVRGFLWSENCDTVEVEHFADWKQAFKSRWFPEWLQKRYPVKCIKNIITPKIIYPEFKLASDSSLHRIPYQRESFGNLRLGESPKRVVPVITSVDLYKYSIGAFCTIAISSLEYETELKNSINQIAQVIKDVIFSSSSSITITHPRNWQHWLLQHAKASSRFGWLFGWLTLNILRYDFNDSNFKPSLKQHVTILDLERVEIWKVGDNEITN